MTKGIELSLDGDHALVLFELLSRWEETEPDRRIEHPAEDVAIDRVLDALQKQLVEPFDPKYLALVQAARERLAPSRG